MALWTQDWGLQVSETEKNGGVLGEEKGLSWSSKPGCFSTVSESLSLAIRCNSNRVCQGNPSKPCNGIGG